MSDQSKSQRKSGQRRIEVPGVVNVRVRYDRIGQVSQTTIDITGPVDSLQAATETDAKTSPGEE